MHLSQTDMKSNVTHCKDKNALFSVQLQNKGQFINGNYGINNSIGNLPWI